MDKATASGFRIYKISQILKRFAGTFRRPQTLKLGGVRQLLFCLHLVCIIYLLGIFGIKFSQVDSDLGKFSLMDTVGRCSYVLMI